MNRNYLSWFLFLIPAILLHLPTLGITPTVWGDELQIVDLGRVLFNPGTDYAMSLGGDGKPLTILFYLGAGIQELAYGFSQSLWGPRIISIASAALAATAFFTWLRLRNIPCLIAVLAAITFFENPSFIQSYRGGRLDGAAFAAIIFCTILLRHSVTKRNSIIALFAGGFGAIGIGLWPSAALLAGLPALELWDARRKQQLSLLFRLVLSSLIGFILVLSILAIGYELLSGDLVTALKRTLTKDASMPVTAEEAWRPAFVMMVSAWPIIILMLIGVTDKKNISIFILLLLTIAGIAFSRPYIFRYIYGLPLCFLLVAQVVESFPSNLELKRFKHTGIALLTAALIWSAGIGTVARSVYAWQTRDQREYSLMVDAADYLLGFGAHKVYIPYSLYYAARSRGWQTYHVYQTQPKDVVSQVYKLVDHIIKFESDDNSRVISAGFHEKKKWISSSVYFPTLVLYSR